VIWLETPAEIASIIGALVSIYLLYSLAAIRKHYLGRAGIPQLIRTLRDYARTLNLQLASFDDSRRDVETLIATIAAALRNLGKKLSGEEKGDVKRLSRVIKKGERAHWWSPRERRPARIWTA